MIKKDKLCILIDDDDDDQLIFSSTVKKHFPSYHLKAFSSFDDAKSVLDNDYEDIGAVFIDLNMPRLNGKEGLRILRNDPNYQRTPLIIYSTSNNPDDVNECLKVGATAFITKPSRINVLVDELSNFLVA
jgi:CheY-like chemotaxis protein